MAIPETAGSMPRERTAPPTTRLLAGVGTVIGLGALAASSCCVLPMVLAGPGASSAVFSGLGELIEIRPYLLTSAVFVLATGWAFFLLRRRSAVCAIDGSCVTPASSRRTGALLGLGTAFVILAIAWEPYVEPAILRVYQ